MDARVQLSSRGLGALRFIGEAHVGIDYWEDPTIRLYRSLGLVFSNGDRINLTAAGLQAISANGSLLKAA